MTIESTDRELKRAWRALSGAATPPPNATRQNPQRLLLFYAVECGMKAVWLKRRSLDLLVTADIKKFSHDLRQLLKDLNIGAELSLPATFRLSKPDRNGQFGDLHQVWRYGGECVSPTDHDCEQKLLKVNEWIQGELR